MSNIIVCRKCGGKFTWSESKGGYPGGKDRADVNCPYCGETYHSVIISGVVTCEKLEKA